MGQLLLFVVVALVVAAIVFGVTVMVSGGDPGLAPVEPDGKALPLPSDRPLAEEDVFRTRFDTVFRGYRMAQVDQAMQRAAYDIGYKTELISVLEAEVAALREGRTADADVLRRAREAAVAPPAAVPASSGPAPDILSSDPADEAPRDEAPAGEAPADGASAGGASAGGAPAGGASAGGAPADSAKEPAKVSEAGAEEKAAERR
ncbi:DivIVA domain-containing protein [Couchioplanes caeruleus]|uniref:DivIVA domain-containing protein n=1 Tax=Couchioplanes caeruleus TaxID=56438 RepID=UPI0020C07CCC|nr:DivIVA domain-containing protein [Couchioplanes caeruleus]UQU65479.1 DivIVA domain-containing protein [Couchioplanes caeruleus]